MKKTTKGAVAAGAAAMLLAGGAGTYAAWTATSDQVAGGGVQTGHLTVTQQANNGWTWTTQDKSGPFDPATMSLAPGDSVKFAGDFKLGIKGTNLTATATVGDASTGSLPAGLTWTPDTNSTLTGLTQAQNNTVVRAGGTLTFDGTATGSMDQTINIANLAVTLKQTAPAVA